MKKRLSMALCLTLVLLLTACGGPAPAPETLPAETTVPQTTAAETTVPETEAIPVIDPGWAGAEYSLPFHQPPGTDFTVSEEADHICIAFTHVTADPDAVSAYLSQLARIGFGQVTSDRTLPEAGGREYVAAGPSGDSLYFAYSDVNDTILILYWPLPAGE